MAFVSSPPSTAAILYIVCSHAYCECGRACVYVPGHVCMCMYRGMCVRARVLSVSLLAGHHCCAASSCGLRATPFLLHLCPRSHITRLCPHIPPRRPVRLQARGRAGVTLRNAAVDEGRGRGGQRRRRTFPAQQRRCVHNNLVCLCFLDVVCIVSMPYLPFRMPCLCACVCDCVGGVCDCVCV